MTLPRPDPMAWGVDCALEPVPGGHRNQVMREAGTSPRVVFKSTRRSEAALDWLGPVQALARDAGFVVPGLLRSAVGTLAVEGWTAEPFVAGRRALTSEMQDLAPQLKAFHRAGIGSAQRPGFASARDLVTELCGGDVDLSRMPSPLVAKLRAIWSDLPGDQTAIHGDLNPGNVLMTDAGPALIDWDEARRDAAVFDLDAALGVQSAQRTAWEIACSWQIEPAYARQQARTLGITP